MGGEIWGTEIGDLKSDVRCQMSEDGRDRGQKKAESSKLKGKEKRAEVRHTDGRKGNFGF